MPPTYDITTEGTHLPHRVCAIGRDSLSLALIHHPFCLVPNAFSLIPNAFSLVPRAFSLIPNAFSLIPTAFSLVPDAFSVLPNAYTARRHERHRAHQSCGAVSSAVKGRRLEIGMGAKGSAA